MKIMMLFVLIRMLPNPVVAVTGGYAKQLEDMRTAWGYYDPIIVQYGIFLKNVFTEFNWGFCTTVGTFLMPVEEYLASKIPATLYVNILSLVFSVPLGVIFGVIAAVFKNRWQDQIINVFIVMMMNRLTINSPIRLHTYFNIGSILLLSGITLRNNSPQAARSPVSALWKGFCPGT